jgi:hypothetical protein
MAQEIVPTQNSAPVPRAQRRGNRKAELEQQKPKIQATALTAELEALEQGFNQGVDQRVAEVSDRIVAKIQGAPMALVQSVLADLQSNPPESEFFRGLGAEIIKAL